MGRPQPNGGLTGAPGPWGGGGDGQIRNLKGTGFPKRDRNDYDAQRGCNERKDYPAKTTVSQAAGRLKGESAVNP